MRLAWQVLVLLGSWQCWEPHEELGRARLFCPVIFVALMQHVLQSSQRALPYSVHHTNIILFFHIKFLFLHVYVYLLHA